jgi:hypothetical protein
LLDMAVVLVVLGKPKGAAGRVLGAVARCACDDGAAGAGTPKPNKPVLVSEFVCSALRSSMSLVKARRFWGVSADRAESDGVFDACPKANTGAEGGMGGGAGAATSVE